MHGVFLLLVFAGVLDLPRLEVPPVALPAEARPLRPVDLAVGGELLLMVVF